jgi:iron(III) transport system permease protein
LFIDSVAAASSDIFRTFWSSALAAVLGLALAFVAARRIAGGGWIWLIPVLLPIAVPGSLLGIGLISLWNTTATAFVYHSEVILVLTYLARFVPVATLVLVARFRRIDRLLIDAARVHMPGPFRAWIQVYIPLFSEAGAVSMFLIFVLSIGELPATILTMPPGGGTMAMRIFNYLHYGASSVVAYLSLVIPVMAILFAAALFAVARAWRVFQPRYWKDGI